jgi:hypothetical protein
MYIPKPVEIFPKTQGTYSEVYYLPLQLCNTLDAGEAIHLSVESNSEFMP